MNKKEAKKLKRDALDLINQVAIMLKDVKYEYQEVYDDETGEERDNPNWNEDNHFLNVMKKVCQDLASKNPDHTETMEYYNSYCYWND